MLVAYVLRLASSELASGQIVGHVVDVATGERIAIRSDADLIAFLRRETNGASTDTIIGGQS